jgi:hypothetical protein
MVSYAANHFDENGNLTNEDTRAHIEKLLKALVDWTQRLKGSRSAATS